MENPATDADTQAAMGQPPSYGEASLDQPQANQPYNSVVPDKAGYNQPPTGYGYPPQAGQPAYGQPVQYGQQPYPQPYQTNQYGAPMQPGTVVVQQPVHDVILVNNTPVEYVPNYLALSCVTFWLCNVIFGGIAMIFSFMSMSQRDARDVAGARRYGKIALYLSITGIVITSILILVLIIIIAAA